MFNLNNKALLIAAAIALACPVSSFAQDTEESLDNGTDPSRLSTGLEAKYEYIDLQNGFSSGTLRLSFTQPFGENQHYSFRLRAPISAVDVFGNSNHDLGDVSAQVTHVFGLTKAHGFIWQAEMVFDTASRPELGTGQNVLKGTLIYAKFLKGGAIFAPAIVQSNSLWGDDSRADVNSTTLDFYYVPKMKDPRNLITFDPSLNFDWENDKQFAGLAVTFGRVIGPAFGGNAIISIKPTVFAGGDKPGKWGVEVGYKVIGF
jgi:hypothetical protein